MKYAQVIELTQFSCSGTGYSRVRVCVGVRAHVRARVVAGYINV